MCLLYDKELGVEKEWKYIRYNYNVVESWITPTKRGWNIDGWATNEILHANRGQQSFTEEELPAGSHLAQWGNCPHCGQKYSNQSALKYHVRLVHSDLTNRLCCYLCPRAFTHRDCFKKHMWERHKVRI
ncbi:uncharacterized protein LOC103505047 [Diaphorina citri]|uniref:Uncharacterized protein LOC103505047 n=1 Tax=Diaphorina citri TaxID=121845 RepID=A0A1S4E6X4_DIACI|nr:uncharacterized protein LOC103505047 [Diaphorina citri]